MWLSRWQQVFWRFALLQIIRQEHNLATLSECSVWLSCCFRSSFIPTNENVQPNCSSSVKFPLLVCSGVLQCMQISHMQMEVTVCCALFQVQILENSTNSYDFHDVKCARCHTQWSLDFLGCDMECAKMPQPVATIEFLGCDELILYYMVLGSESWKLPAKWEYLSLILSHVGLISSCRELWDCGVSWLSGSVHDLQVRDRQVWSPTGLNYAPTLCS